MTFFQDGIAIFDNVFLRNEELISLVENEGNWRDGYLGNGSADTKIRVSQIHDLDPNSDIHTELVKIFIYYLNEYGKKYPHLKINGAEGLRVPDPCPIGGHPEPNDVFALGGAGLAAVPPSWGYLTEGELFQSSGAVLGLAPDLTNVDRMSASLGIGPAPGGPPFIGPFSPNTAAPVPTPGRNGPSRSWRSPYAPAGRP